MKVAISTSKGGLEDSVFPAFGRCLTFTLFESGKKPPKVRVLPNPGAGSGGGAGIAAAQAVVDAGADTVVTGNCGPNALAVLLASGIKVYSASGNVENALKGLVGGRLAPIERPSASPHAGLAPGRQGRGRQGGSR